MDKIREYYRLTKPGIVYGNDLSAIAGFFLASKKHIDIGLFVAMLIGVSLVIASACVFNNFLDYKIDQKMARTKKRALVQGTISRQTAFIYGLVLGLIGLGLLLIFANWLTAAIALAGMFFYVVVYGWGKRATVHGTLIGSISGATPPVIGYAAVTNHLDWAALLLFLILTAWQMPHFYAIAIFRSKDYAAAHIPVLPVKKGLQQTKIQIIAYVLAFILASIVLSPLGYTGYTYFIVMALVGLYWLRIGAKAFGKIDDNAWARKMFGLSLVTLLVLSVMLSINAWLP